jgi:hypothetical protein
MSKGYKVIWFGKETVCYGELEETSNFYVVCENEEHDDTWCLGVGHYTGELLTWDNVVPYLQGYFESEIIEITAV